VSEDVRESARVHKIFHATPLRLEMQTSSAPSHYLQITPWNDYPWKVNGWMRQKQKQPTWSSPNWGQLPMTVRCVVGLVLNLFFNESHFDA